MVSEQGYRKDRLKVAFLLYKLLPKISNIKVNDVRSKMKKVGDFA